MNVAFNISTKWECICQVSHLTNARKGYTFQDLHSCSLVSKRKPAKKK